MSRPLQPLRDHGDEGFLQSQIKRTRDGDLLRRLQVILFRMQGKPPKEVAELTGFTPESVRTCVHRWNDGGVDGLRTRPRSGRPRKDVDDQIRDLTFKKIEGTLDDGTPFTAISFHGQLKKTAGR